MSEIGKASGALAVLGITIAALVAGGALTLLVQRAIERSATGRHEA